MSALPLLQPSRPLAAPHQPSLPNPSTQSPHRPKSSSPTSSPSIKRPTTDKGNETNKFRRTGGSKFVSTSVVEGGDEIVSTSINEEGGDDDGNVVMTGNEGGEKEENVTGVKDDVAGSSGKKIDKSYAPPVYPVLESYQSIQSNPSPYVGPTLESNWVLPNHLLVGAYPAVTDDEENFSLLNSIVSLGITTFVCLQVEYPGEDVAEEEWRSGRVIRPYFNDVKRIVGHVDEVKSGLVPIECEDDCSVDEMTAFYSNFTTLSRLSFVHVPIVDCSVTDDSTMLNLCLSLVALVESGEMLYLHCWGGHGRTGTVVSIMLHLMYGMDAIECMRRCQFVHDLRLVRIEVGSPQTMSQVKQVKRIVEKLEKEEWWKKSREGKKEASEKSDKVELMKEVETTSADADADADNAATTKTDASTNSSAEDTTAMTAAAAAATPTKTSLRTLRDESRLKRRSYPLPTTTAAAASSSTVSTASTSSQLPSKSTSTTQKRASLDSSSSVSISLLRLTSPLPLKAQKQKQNDTDIDILSRSVPQSPTQASSSVSVGLISLPVVANSSSGSGGKNGAASSTVFNQNTTMTMVDGSDSSSSSPSSPTLSSKLDEIQQPSAAASTSTSSSTSTTTTSALNDTRIAKATGIQPKPPSSQNQNKTNASGEKGKSPRLHLS